MHPEEIKAAMRMAGMTPAALADELGVANSSVSQVISGLVVSARIRGRIAQVLGKSVDSIWAPKPTLRRTKAAELTTPTKPAKPRTNSRRAAA